jgi:hypothetical protein
MSGWPLLAHCVEKPRLIDAPVVDSLCLGAGDSAMMGERRVMQEALFYGFSLERHVPDNHMLRKIDCFLDLSDLRAHLGPYYGTALDRCRSVVAWVSTARFQII